MRQVRKSVVVASGAHCDTAVILPLIAFLDLFARWQSRPMSLTVIPTRIAALPLGLRHVHLRLHRQFLAAEAVT